MILKEAEARKIIDLNPYGSIDNEIAERQFQVILKGFNSLNQEGNNFLYIADEVGLGKTYVALGIASLLRHFSNKGARNTYKDLIIVPKKNLQYKWVKEIKNFVNHNYLIYCNIVKSVLDTPVAACNSKNIHHKLEVIKDGYPSYEIFRNSSFSVATSSDENWKYKLKEQLPIYLQEDFQKGIKLFRKKEEEILLKRLYGYFLNISIPEVNLLIVDEAHNFKHGIGKDVSNRNQVVSRMMGVIQAEEDTIIFENFPELKSKIRPKATKVIFLSATPIDNGLQELKQQMDVFLPEHQFSSSQNIEEDVKEKLNSFMIRGLMSIKLKEEEISRNMYRYEHRRGNVTKEKDAQPQYIDGDLESAIVGLMQFKTLKDFSEKNNKSFEIGMLAGFETFKGSSVGEQEYEETSSRKIKKSEDQNVITTIAESYFEEFGEHLPHPKQDNLINILMDGIRSGNKSLVFVRRIASVIELERKLTHQVEAWHFEKIKSYLKDSPRLIQLKEAFEERHDIQEIESIIERLSHRLMLDYYEKISSFLGDNTNPFFISEQLLILYNSEKQTEEILEFRKQIKDHKGKRNTRTKLKEIAIQLLEEIKQEFQIESDANGEEQFPDIKEESIPYFFTNYFSSKKYIEGFNFRKRVSTKDWYRFNIYHLQELINELYFDLSKQNNITFTGKEKTEALRMDVLNNILFENIITPNEIADTDINVNEIFQKKTFLNLLFEGLLGNEFREWIAKQTKTLDFDKFFQIFDTLIEIVQGIFRNGSGILPAYIAESMSKTHFEQNLISILQTSFPEILIELKKVLNDFDKIITSNFPDKSKIQRTLYGQVPVAGASGHHKRDISRVATQFRMPGYPYVLITTDILKEGEDLHLYCKDVYHYGIAWNPSDMEQRTGRIDRINSKCYFELKNEGQNNFENSLQVFYPYLADTLEVNQIAKVFTKMNDFVQTFYDITTTSERDTKASTDEIVKEIPNQIKTLLQSKYDYQKFTGIPEKDFTELQLISGIGYTAKYLRSRMEELFLFLKKHFNSFYIEPHLKKNNDITATINLNERRAPLIVKFVKGKSFDAIDFSINSIIGKNTHTKLRPTKVKEEIKKRLMEKDMELVDDNDFLIAQKVIEINTSHDLFIKVIQDVIQVADDLEKEFTDDEDLEY